jgi:hypothetical protein
MREDLLAALSLTSAGGEDGKKGETVGIALVRVGLATYLISMD